MKLTRVDLYFKICLCHVRCFVPVVCEFGDRTYFVEYQFPVVATSRDDQQPNAMATEVMRVVSKKVTDKCKYRFII